MGTEDIGREGREGQWNSDENILAARREGETVEGLAARFDLPRWFVRKILAHYVNAEGE